MPVIVQGVDERISPIGEPQAMVIRDFSRKGTGHVHELPFEHLRSGLRPSLRRHTRIKPYPILSYRLVLKSGGGQEGGSFLDEFPCEFIVYDEESRTSRYTKPNNLKDDALHATNDAQLLGLRLLHTINT